jgi:pimeloyl-ACP methyl ester carboxylesterase
VNLSHHRGGSGEPLVLIHGVGSQWQVWAPVLERLERERDVIALDLPGHGGSPTLPIGVVPSAPALAGAVAAFLDSIGVERAVLGGNSLGGWVALELAKRGRARAVVAVSPAGFFTPWEAALTRWSLKLNGAAARRGRPVTEALLVRPRGRPIALGSVMAHGGRVPAAQAVAMTRNLAASAGFGPTLDTLTRERFGGGEQVRVPVTVVWGGRDAILFPWQAERALAELPGARHVPLRGAGHVPMWDDPDTVARELLAAGRR